MKLSCRHHHVVIFGFCFDDIFHRILHHVDHFLVDRDSRNLACRVLLDHSLVDRLGCRILPDHSLVDHLGCRILLDHSLVDLDSRDRHPHHRCLGSHDHLLHLEVCLAFRTSRDYRGVLKYLS